MTSTSNLATSSSPETAFLDEMRRSAKRWIGFGAIAVIVGVLLLAISLGEVGVVVGCVSVGCGLFFVWFGVEWLRLLPKARLALAMPPIDLRLQTWRGIGFWRRFTNAQLWQKDSNASRSLAQFSETMHWAKPRYMLADKIPAKVYGYPVAGATVVASCTDGVVVGRIKRSHFGEGEQ